MTQFLKQNDKLYIGWEKDLYSFVDRYVDFLSDLTKRVSILINEWEFEKRFYSFIAFMQFQRFAKTERITEVTTKREGTEVAKNGRDWTEVITIDELKKNFRLNYPRYSLKS